MAAFTHSALDALSREAALLELPMPHERKGLDRGDAALVVDRLLVRVARGSGALELAIGEGLAALSLGDRVLRLGFSGIGDYARERLGVGPGTAKRLAWRASALAERPLLREAVRSGEVSPRKAEAILGVARGDAEAAWVERARHETVRGLTALAREARLRGDRLPALGPGAGSSSGGPAGGDEEDAGTEGGLWERLHLPLPAGGAGVVREALDVAARLLGSGSPVHARLEAICAEALGTWPVEPGEDAPGRELIRRGLAAVAQEALEVETHRWLALEEISPVEPVAAAPVPVPVPVPGPGFLGDGAFDPWRTDGALRALAAMRDRWDEVMGHLALLVRHLGLWRELGFASLAHYAAERLGLAVRTVEQRASLERRLYELSPLREAMRTGRLSYEQARLVARVASPEDAEAWIARAERSTCIELQRTLEARELGEPVPEAEIGATGEASPTAAPADAREAGEASEGGGGTDAGEGSDPGEASEAGATAAPGRGAGPQMCERDEVTLLVPARVADLFRATCRAVRSASDRLLPDGACLVLAAAHFLDTWRPLLPARRTAEARARARDRDRCQVPGCSRAAVHAHHVRYRSRGGEDVPENLVSLCALCRSRHNSHYAESGIMPRASVESLRAWRCGLRDAA